jgi:hypothetical protein
MDRAPAHSPLIRPPQPWRLYSFSLSEIFNLIGERSWSADSCEDPEILTAMIENILSDPDRFRTPEGAPLAHAIARRIAVVAPGAFSDVEQRDRFLGLFGA